MQERLNPWRKQWAGLNEPSFTGRSLHGFVVFDGRAEDHPNPSKTNGWGPRSACSLQKWRLIRAKGPNGVGYDYNGCALRVKQGPPGMDRNGPRSKFCFG